ncbi:MAG: error-prone DNA polymerase, partial [Novosphingobium sp.]
RSLSPPILCQGRGSAANSLVCYFLGVTPIDPVQEKLLFSRFLSEERDEPPDIDVDFEHERREEVIQYIYRRYGRDRAGIAATVIHYRQRSAIREVGKALGLTEDVTARLAGTIWGSWSGAELPETRLAQAGFDPANPELARLRDMVEQLLEYPRHLSQHVGGFVLSESPLDELVPIHNGAMPERTFIEWDKDDLETLGLMKVDVLALGMLTAIRKCFDLLRQHGFGDFELASVPREDPATYAMLQKGDSIGTFQVESRAQIAMLPRMKPKCLYDLVIQVAIVRPGPIQGGMVHPYLRRRAGEEAVEYPGPPGEIRSVLEKTLGVPLFQEQAMKLAIVAARFTPAQADGLRRAMATFRHNGTMHHYQERLIEGMVGRGYPRDFAERCFEQIKGFGEYGFPESHAQAFGWLAYVSSWLKRHYPAAFTAALLNSQPMGFYAPAQLVRDAQEHGVSVRPIDVGASGWDSTLESERVLRLGLRQIGGFREAWAEALVAARAAAPIVSMEDLARRAGLPARALRLLADADALGALGQNRRAAG